MGRHAHSNNYNYIEYYHCITCIEKTLGGLYIENGVLYDRQSLWPRRSSVGVHLYTFHTSARETYDTWLPAKWGAPLRTIVQWKCVSYPHWWYLFSAFVWRTILRKWLACSLETGLDLWLCFNIVSERNNEPRKSQSGMFHWPSSIHWYAMFSAMRKLVWAFVSNLRAICSISTKQAFWCLKQPGKSHVPLVGVWIVRTAFWSLYHLPKFVLI